jgi:hypothetical protein
MGWAETSWRVVISQEAYEVCRILKTAFGRRSAHGGQVCCYSCVHLCVHLRTTVSHMCTPVFICALLFLMCTLLFVICALLSHAYTSVRHVCTSVYISVCHMYTSAHLRARQLAREM